MRPRIVILLAALHLLAAGRLRGDDSCRLVLFVTVDQLRGDAIDHMRLRSDDGGFRRLTEHGVHYANARYRHSTTYTSVGHATLFTGAAPAAHGIVGNDWFDVREGRRVYSCEDPRHTILGEDPPDAPYGSSPVNLLSTTIGDELHLATGGRSRTFSVSLKDRGAILPGGHYGKAFWYSARTGRFVTSSYYYDATPRWVDRFNDARPTDVYRGRDWGLLDHPSSYDGEDDRPYEKPYKHLGRTFPHPLEGAKDSDFFGALRYTPFCDEMTVAFVKELVQREHVGGGPATDLLAISLSATDYIGHAFGPYSVEAEDNLRRLDRTLADLLDFIDDEVGLDRTLVVLSSDHGVDAIPEHRRRLVADLGEDAARHAGRHDVTESIRRVNADLMQRFETDRPIVAAFWNPCVYLDHDVVAALGVDPSRVEDAVARRFLAEPGFAHAFTRSDVVHGRAGGSATARMVERSFHPQRSGDVVLVQEPFWLLHPDFDKHAAMHGSPYGYDTHVPIIIAARGLAARRIHRSVAPADVAPTIAVWLGIAPPSASDGDPLEEVLAARAARK